MFNLWQQKYAEPQTIVRANPDSSVKQSHPLVDITHWFLYLKQYEWSKLPASTEKEENDKAHSIPT